MIKHTVFILALAGAVTYNTSLTAEPRFLRSAYNLEDPRGYCIDIPGFGPRLRKDAPITTHSCKYSRPGFWVDELVEQTSKGQLRLPEYDLCLSADSLTAGSHVNTVDCADESAHGWTVNARGRGNVTPSDTPELCLSLGEKVYVNSGTANLTPYSSRNVTLKPCTQDRMYFQSWRWADTSEQQTLTANTLREGMSNDLAGKIRELGKGIRPPETFALYANQSRMFNAADVTVSGIIQYGKEDRQQLQVYHGNNRNHPTDTAPIILLVHGGGFSSGGLEALVDASTHFAGLGYIAVNMTYPLTPDTSWPSGGQSVAAAVSWIKDNSKDIKGDPDNIFVLGHSAGGAHVADFIFKPGIVRGDSPEVAGAILASPASIELNPAAAGESTRDYYGEHSNEWADKQILGNLDRTSIPVLVLVAELDPDGFHLGAAKLLTEMVVDKGLTMRFRQLHGHNHISYISSIGTDDTMATEEILDFMFTAGRN